MNARQCLSLSLGLIALSPSQAHALPPTDERTNTYSIVSIADESGSETAFYQSRLAKGERIPEILPCSQERWTPLQTNDQPADPGSHVTSLEPGASCRSLTSHHKRQNISV
jgi:hypothetical protein